MKKTILLFCLLFSVALFGQERSSLDYHAGQNFIGADMAVLHFEDFTGALVGVNFGRNLTERMAIGAAAGFGLGNYDESIPVLCASPFLRYNILIDGPVAVFLQANLTVAAVLYDSESYGIIWPNLSGGLSYRLSEHFTAFAKMGMLSHMFFAFGSGTSEGGSSGGSWVDDWTGEWHDQTSSDNGGFPLLAGFTKQPVIGIYYTF